MTLMVPNVQKNSKKLYLRYPESIDLDLLVQKFKSSRHFSALERISIDDSELKYNVAKVFSLIYSSQFRNGTYKHFGKSSPLSSSILKAFVGKDYKRYITFLKDESILIISTYKVGGFPKGYQLVHPHDSSRAIEFSDFNQEYILKDWTNLLAARQKDEGPRSELVMDIEKNILQLDLDGDIEKALEDYCERKRKQNEQPHENKFWNVRDALTMKQFHQSWFCVRPNDSRLYSTITGCPKELRKLLSYKGQRLTELDQSASQPFLLLHFYNEMRAPEAKIEAANYFNLWNETLNGGDFYTNFLPGEDRNAIKQAFVAGVLNRADFQLPKKGTDQARIAELIADRFKTDFPLLWGEVTNLKRFRRPEIKLKKPKMVHSQFAVYMQELEASIFIDGIAAECLERGIFFYTVHDCIGCLPNDLETVKEIAVRKVTKKIGFTPRFKS